MQELQAKLDCQEAEAQVNAACRLLNRYQHALAVLMLLCVVSFSLWLMPTGTQQTQGHWRLDQIHTDKAQQLYQEQHSNGQMGRHFVDLATGDITSGGISLSYGQTILVGDRSIIELESCVGGGGGGFGDRLLQIKHTAADGTTTTGPCGRNNWSTVPLAIQGSGVVVFYSEQTTAAGKRYPVAVIKS